MDIQEIKAKRIVLEQEIFNLIYKFENDAGIVVGRIDLNQNAKRMFVCQRPEMHTTSVSVKIKF
jgi:hypothetical protein